MTKKPLAVSRFELRETGGHGTLEILQGASGGEAQVALELGESHFDGVKVRAVGRQISPRSFQCVGEQP